MSTVDRSAILLQKGTLCSIFRSGQLASIYVMEKLSTARDRDCTHVESCQHIHPSPYTSHPSAFPIVICLFRRSILIPFRILFHIFSTCFPVILFFFF